MLSIVRRVPGKHVRLGSQDAPSAYGSIRDIFATIRSLSVTFGVISCNVRTWFLGRGHVIAANVKYFFIPEGIEGRPTNGRLVTVGPDWLGVSFYVIVSN